MKRTRLFGLSIAGCAGAVACGVIAIPPEPIAPVNECSTDSVCVAKAPDASVPAQCFGGACVSNTAFRPILVVSVPEGPFSPLDGFGGTTFALPDSYQTKRLSLAPGCTTAPTLFECDFLPPLAAVVNGNLRVGASYGTLLWPPNGLRPPNPQDPPPPAPTFTSLPVHAVFHPMWLDPATGNPIVASKLGLPLDDRVATVSRATSIPVNIPLFAPTTLDKAVPGFVFGGKGLLPQPIEPTDPSGVYEVEIVPDSPFDVFPPYVTTGKYAPPLAIALAQATTASQQIDLSGSFPVYKLPTAQDPTTPLSEQDYEVDEVPGAPSLAGWTVHVEDDEGHRVSGMITLPAGPSKVIQVRWANSGGTLDQTGQTLFIVPPPGVDEPQYVVQATGSAIVGPNFPYPALPAPVTATGSVIRGDNFQPAGSAHVIVFANGDPQAGVFEADGTTIAQQLRYKKTLATDPQGNFSATLPPGNLRAYVVPDAPDLAITAVGLDLLTAPPAQGGKSLTANPRTHVRGRAVLADGTPLYAAEVVIDASPDDPFPPYLATDDPLLRPREVRGYTDPNGEFDVLSDPGLVDISIRPREGTNLPWVVLTNRTVPPSVQDDAGAAGQLNLASDVVVPLPTPFTETAPTGIITDSLGNAVPHAVVRAYAFPTPAAPDGGPPPTRAARLIGSTTTDTIGAFQIFTTPPE